MDDIVTKSRHNLCAGIAQQANQLAGDMFSAYWSATTGEKIPAVFISQARSRLATITELLGKL